MIDRGWFGRLFVLLMVVALSVVGVRAAAAEPWPIKTFEVVPVPVLPSDTLGFRDFLEDLPNAMTAEDKARLIEQVSGDDHGMVFAKDLIPQIETALAEAAAFFEQNGFPPPAISSVVEKDGVPAYRVFLVNGLASAGVYRPNLCDDAAIDRQIVLLNYDWVGRVDDVTAAVANLTLDGRHIAAHELFHAVQYNTPFYQSCDGYNVGDWITEGTAEAMGWAAVQDAWPVGVYTPGWDEIWGLRDYEIRLPRPLDTGSDLDSVAYATNSFWTYLGEYRAAGGTPATPGMNPIDMSYLAELFDSAPVPRDCSGSDALCIAEISWLDQQVRGVLGAPLRYLYARFMQAYALYGQHRLAGETLYDELWLDKAFDTYGCREIALQPGGENRQHVVELEPFVPWSARCWQIRLLDFEKVSIPVAVTVEMPSGAQSPSLLQLTSTTADGSRRLGEAVLDNQPGDMQRVEWVYEFHRTADAADAQGTLFLLTNVADAADATVEYAGINNSGLRVTFTALPNYLSMAASEVDVNELMDEFDLPLGIELDHGQARVQPGLFKQDGESFIGVAHSAGIVNPCMLQITGHTDREPGEFYNNILNITLQVSGPIGPGEYGIAPYRQSTGDPSEGFPAGLVVSGVVLKDMPEGTNDLRFESGLFVIDAITDSEISGYLRGIAHNRALSDVTGDYEIVETRYVGVAFALTISGVIEMYGEGNYPYPCVEIGQMTVGKTP